MQRRLWILIASCGLLCAATPVAGHHAFGAEFDPDAPIRLQGKVVKLEWVNPHAWIHIEVKKPDGTTEVWMVEGGRRTRSCAAGSRGSRLLMAPSSSSMDTRRRTTRSSGRTAATSRSRTAARFSWDRREPVRLVTAAIRPNRRKGEAASSVSRDRDLSTPNLQLPTPNGCQADRLRGLWALEVGSWELSRLRFSAACLRESNPPAGRRNREPQRERDDCDQPCSTCRARSRHRDPLTDGQREEQRQGQRRDLEPERLAVITLDRLRHEQRRAGHDHHGDAAEQPCPGVLREVRNRLTAQPHAEHAQIQNQQRSSEDGESEQVHGFDDRKQPRRVLMACPIAVASHHSKNGRSDVSTGALPRRNDAAGGPVDEIGLRLNVAVEPVVGNHPARDDDARPEEE